MNDNLTLTISYRSHKYRTENVLFCPRLLFLLSLSVSHCSEQPVDVHSHKMNAYNQLFLPELFVWWENMNVDIRSV